MSRVEWISEGLAPEALGADPFAWLGVTLPSQESAAAVVRGEPGSLFPLLLHYLGRSAIAGVGLFAAGARGADLVKYAAVSAGSIEAVLLFEALRGTVEIPTGENATEVVRGDAGALGTMLGLTFVRGLIIGAGLALFGVRGTQLVKYALAGSAAVEAFVLSYAWYDERLQPNTPRKIVAQEAKP